MLVSVIIPTRNRPDLVLRAVRSALAQTHGDLEVLVVVDGPCSKTAASLAEVSDSRLRLIQLAESVGGSDARNTGVQNAAGEWVAFLDDDDEWLPAKIEKQMAVALQATEQYPIVSTGMIGISPGGEFPWPRRYPGPAEPICEYLFNRRSFFRGEGQLQTSVLLARLSQAASAGTRTRSGISASIRFRASRFISFASRWSVGTSSKIADRSPTLRIGARPWNGCNPTANG
jgi:glycosyltransferase involved in cell wall biosynthesis